jgi:hypothetical protein
MVIFLLSSFIRDVWVNVVYRRGSDAVYAVDGKGDPLLIWFWGGLQVGHLALNI